MTTSQPQYISVTDTAKLIRQALKSAFPAQRFSVRSSKYAGGASIDIGWTDGPTDAEVSAVTDGFQGQSFDGSIDLAYGMTSWLEADGTAHVAGSPGTTASRGSHPEIIEDAASPSAQLVHFGANYVMTARTLSPEFVAECGHLAERNGNGQGTQCRACGNWMTGGDWTIAYADSTAVRLEIVCSPTCAGRLAARHTARG